MLALSLFGTITVTRDGNSLAQFRSQTELALLVYLAHTGQPHTREAVADLLWEARSTTQSLSNLRTALSRLRKQVGKELVVTRKTLALRPEDLQQVDSVCLQQELQAIGVPETPAEADRLKGALALYTGDFLAGFYLADAPRFNEWVVVEQERMRQQVIIGLQRLIAYAFENNDPVSGIEAARRWIAIDELSEAAHTRLIHLLALNGQPNAALRQYDKLVTLFAEEMGVAPTRETADLIARIGRGEIVPIRAAPASAPVDVPHNLPRELTPFVGRVTERDAVLTRLLDPVYPLVTLIGEGGMGKTRLALAVAREIVAEPPDAFPDGVWFVPLEGIDAPNTLREAIAAAIGTAMGLTFHGPRAQSEQLLTLLQSKHCLIVLDNFEHLLETDAPDLIIDLLRSGPNVHLLATSRAPLGLRSEYVVRLAGLPVPFDAEPSAEPSKEAPEASPPISVEAYDSIRLFTERSARTGGVVDLSDYTDDIVAICRHVAGIPLGIELAAAWTGSMTPKEIATAIGANVDFLATSLRDVPPRQRSMRAVFDYSWALLDDKARKALARTTVFRGGFGYEAAEVVLGDCCRELDRLVDHSLLERGGDGRFRMHELLREYAAEKLAQAVAGDANSNAHDNLSEAQVRAHHAAFYLELVGHVTLAGDPTGKTMSAARTDLDNIRQAWQWAVAGPQPGALRTGLEGLWTFYHRQSLFQEAEAAFAAAVNALEATDPRPAPNEAIVASLQTARAFFLNILNRYDEAIALSRIVLARGETLNDPLLLAHGHLAWGTALFRQGHFDESLVVLERGLPHAQRAGVESLEADIRRRMGTALLEQADMPRARTELEQALSIYRRVSMPIGEANLLGDLGWLEQRAHNLDASRDYLAASLALHRQLNNRHGVTIALINLAAVSGLTAPDRRRSHAINMKRWRIWSKSTATIIALWPITGSVSEFTPRRLMKRPGSTTNVRWPSIGKSAIRRACLGKNNLGLLYNHLGDYRTALALHEDALRTSRELHSQTTEGGP